MATIRKKPSGNYEVQIRLSGLKPITKTFPTKTLATAFVREVEGNTKLQQALGKPIIEKITFLEVTDLYMEQYDKKDSENMTGRLNWWCKRLGDYPITEINQLIIDDHLITLSEKVTGSTCRRYKSTISAIFEFFIKHPKYKRLLITNPVKGEAVTSFSENPAKERFLSDTEQENLLFACKSAKWNKLYINSPGGSVTAGMSIYDTMQFIKPDVSTMCIGQAASMGALLLTGGAIGKRYCLPNSRMMIHQPLGGFQGQASDIEIHAKEILTLKDKLNEIMAHHTGQPLEVISQDTDRDNFLSAQQAVKYGLVDELISSRENTSKNNNPE